MPTLYDIGEDLRAIEELLLEVGGDVSDIDAEQAIDQWLAEYGTARDEKVDAYCAVLREIEARREARKNEADRLYALAAVDDNAVRKLKERLLWFFEMNHIVKLETARFRVGVAANGGVQPVDITKAAEELPEEYQKLTVSANTKAIREALEAGELLDFAKLIERGRHLRIR